MSIPDTFHSCSPEQLRRPQLLAYTGCMEEPDDLLNRLRALVGDVQMALSRLRAARRRAWDIYMLATQTDGASWLNVNRRRLTNSKPDDPPACAPQLPRLGRRRPRLAWSHCAGTARGYACAPVHTRTRRGWSCSTEPETSRDSRHEASHCVKASSDR